MKLGMTAWNLLPERQGRISVRLDQCAIDGDFSARQVGLRAGPQVRITIHSPEPDLSPGVMERMFEPYAFKSPSRHHGGLELFIVQEIANENDGAVTVASTPGAGTTFHLYFPVPA